MSQPKVGNKQANQR